MVTPRAADDPAKGKKEVDAYLARLPDEQRAALEKVRETIRAAAPGATEAISYGIPSFKLDGRAVVWYAGFKNHSSFFPLTEGIRRAHGKDLEGYETSKGTLRFPADEPPPATLLRKLVRTRIAENEELARSRERSR